MDTLDKYLVREFLSFFAVVLLGLSLIYLGSDFLANLTQSGEPVSKLSQIYLYRIPATLNQFVPVACLMATLLVLTAMTRQNEILALYASGVSSLRLVSTFVAAVAVLSTISFIAFDSLVPAFAKKEFRAQQGQVSKSDVWLEGDFSGLWYRSGNVVYHIGQFDPTRHRIIDVHVYWLSSSFRVLEAIHAKEAVFQAGDWRLNNGFRVEYPEVNKFPKLIKFDSIGGVILDKPADFKTLKLRENTMKLKELRKYIERNQKFGFDTTGERVHYHERVALVFTPLIFILLGIPFAMRPTKNHSMPKSMAFCFLIVFAYLLLFRISLSVGRAGHVPPVVSAWFPNGLFLGLAGLFHYRTR